MWRRLRSERGQAFVEFALVFPLLCLLLFGVIELGRAFNYWNDLNQLAGDGARFAAVNRNPGPIPGSLSRSLATQADTSELRSNVNVCIAIPDNTVGQPVEVRTSYRYGFPLVAGFVHLFDPGSDFGSIVMRGHAVMRLEQLATSDGIGDFQGSC